MHGSLRDELEVKSGALVTLCRKHGVAALDLFGSGARDDWRPEESDLDFIVEFHRDERRSLADRYLALAEDLEALFGRPVDLLTQRAIRNPYLRRAIDESRARIYTG